MKNGKNRLIILRIIWECLIIRLTDRMIFEITVNKTDNGYDLKCFSKHNNFKYKVSINQKA